MGEEHIYYPILFFLSVCISLLIFYGWALKMRLEEAEKRLETAEKLLCDMACWIVAVPGADKITPRNFQNGNTNIIPFPKFEK